MRIVVMAGGRGSRIGGLEKPLLEICDRKILEAVLETAYDLSPNVYVAVSPNTPKTRDWCIERKITVIDTPGNGYPYDIGFVLEKLDPPLLFLPADTPFVTTRLLKQFVERALTLNTDIVTLLVSRHCFPKNLVKEKPAPLGVSLFKRKRGYWANIIMCNFPELLDIDTIEDLKQAMRICRK